MQSGPNRATGKFPFEDDGRDGERVPTVHAYMCKYHGTHLVLCMMPGGRTGRLVDPESGPDRWTGQVRVALP